MMKELPSSGRVISSESGLNFMVPYREQHRQKLVLSESGFNVALYVLHAVDEGRIEMGTVVSIKPYHLTENHVFLHHRNIFPFSRNNKFQVSLEVGPRSLIIGVFPSLPFQTYPYPGGVVGLLIAAAPPSFLLPISTPLPG